ncbi:unnamed protein product [Didymodactylos carnosus]|uniref:Uncharacterized protein n=1 Tax=Didymodactylos carnosus TaxID=1234261 RepID=A0A8S2EZF9_9BILA|nr:unnamed protein product [Didymodactylos carnosus]CAF4162106.1 unnamed protein product [Didymodactylos carnosus]
MLGKAFSSINPSLLITKLKEICTSKLIINFVNSFCEARDAYVSLEDGITSKIKLMNYSVLQGSSLLPISVNLYRKYALDGPSPRAPTVRK